MSGAYAGFNKGGYSVCREICPYAVAVTLYLEQSTHMHACAFWQTIITARCVLDYAFVLVQGAKKLLYMCSIISLATERGVCLNPTEPPWVRPCMYMLKFAKNVQHIDR